MPASENVSKQSRLRRNQSTKKQQVSFFTFPLCCLKENRLSLVLRTIYTTNNCGSISEFDKWKRVKRYSRFASSPRLLLRHRTDWLAVDRPERSLGLFWRRLLVSLSGRSFLPLSWIMSLKQLVTVWCLNTLLRPTRTRCARAAELEVGDHILAFESQPMLHGCHVQHLNIPYAVVVVFSLVVLAILYLSPRLSVLWTAQNGKNEAPWNFIEM